MDSIDVRGTRTIRTEATLTTWLYTYRSRGFDGFSDFSIVGDVYSPGGGAAKHVAIHLTELEETTIVANHFVSRTPPQKGNNQAKYFSALGLLGSWYPIQGLHPVPISILRWYESTTNPTLRNTIPALEN